MRRVSLPIGFRKSGIMNRDISLLLIGAGIGFMKNLAAVLLELEFKSWADRVNKKRIIEGDFRNIKICTTPEMMRLINPDQVEGKEFKGERINGDGGMKSKFDWNLVLKFHSSITIWAVVIFLGARNC